MGICLLGADVGLLGVDANLLLLWIKSFQIIGECFETVGHTPIPCAAKFMALGSASIWAILAFIATSCTSLLVSCPLQGCGTLKRTFGSLRDKKTL